MDRKQRQDYIALYSRQRVTWACRKASSHKARAKKAGRTEHFTAAEWLDLCAVSDFCCAYCGEEAPLEPHHQIGIVKSGANTIDNIVPLCKRCHDYWHEHPHDVSELWMADQQQLLDAFCVGDRVKRNSHCRLPYELVGRRQEGIIVQLFPARRASPPLRGIDYSKDARRPKPGYWAEIEESRRWNGDNPDVVIIYDFGKGWREGAAKALVHWLRTIRGKEVVINELVMELSEVQKVSKAALIYIRAALVCLLSSGATNAVGTVVVAIASGLRKAGVGLVITGSDDLINLTNRFLVVEVVNLALARTGVGKILLTIHVSAIPSCHN
jgi:hypothetical protein